MSWVRQSILRFHHTTQKTLFISMSNTSSDRYKVSNVLSVVAYTYNPSYLGGGDPGNHGSCSMTAWAKG
jgi:hypothetical protein